MSPNDRDSPEPDDDAADEGTEVPIDVDVSGEGTKRERLGRGADRAVEGFDERIVDLLGWLLDTETRSRIYVHLRTQPGSTSEEVAEGTGLYPSTVREALAELHEEGTVTREKRESEGAGNNPYEYRAIAPSELVRGMLGQVQDELNTLFTLDRYLGGEDVTSETDPITISVGEADEPAESDDSGAVGEDDAANDEGDATGDEDDVVDGEDDAADDEGRAD